MQIVFPSSTAPSVNPTENGGRLINAYAEKAPVGSRNSVLWRRAPGLDLAFMAGEDGHRGALLVGTVLYIVNGEKVYTVTKAGTTYTVSELEGTIGGVGPVTMAHNMRAPSAQILIVHSGGVSQVVGNAVSDFSDGDLPAPAMVTYQDGYFFFAIPDGRVFASDINDDEISELNYTTAEAMPDGLIRAVPFNRNLLLMGEYTTEFWSNVGNATGFPYDRGPVIEVGLFGIHAVAGHEAGFPGPLVWVGNDGVVYQLMGYTPTRISSPHIERMISSLTNRVGLRATSFISAGHAFIVLKTDEWTLVYDLSTGEWHERQSYKSKTWRAEFCVNAFNEWLAFDETSNAVYRVNDRSRREAAQPLVWEVISSQQHSFPGRVAVTRASFDLLTGHGVDRGISPIETNPRVSISWSDDGGRTFGNDLLRDLGTQGEQTSIDIWRTGMTSRIGRQWRLRVSDPVEVALLGGSMFGEERA